jgi:hypothetical protein
LVSDEDAEEAKGEDEDEDDDDDDALVAVGSVFAASAFGLVPFFNTLKSSLGSILRLALK